MGGAVDCSSEPRPHADPARIQSVLSGARSRCGVLTALSKVSASISCRSCIIQFPQSLYRKCTVDRSSDSVHFVYIIKYTTYFSKSQIDFVSGIKYTTYFSKSQIIFRIFYGCALFSSNHSKTRDFCQIIFNCRRKRDFCRSFFSFKVCTLFRGGQVLPIEAGMNPPLVLFGQRVHRGGLESCSVGVSSR